MNNIYRINMKSSINGDIEVINYDILFPSNFGY